MSRHLPEVNAYGQTSARLALQAWRLRERSKAATGEGRRAMLERMSRAYFAWGLAKSHAEFGSESTARALLQAAVCHIDVARSQR